MSSLSLSDSSTSVAESGRSKRKSSPLKMNSSPYKLRQEIQGQILAEGEQASPYFVPCEKKLVYVPFLFDLLKYSKGGYEYFQVFELYFFVFISNYLWACAASRKFSLGLGLTNKSLKLQGSFERLVTGM